MSSLSSFSTGLGTGKRLSHVPPLAGAKLQVQAPVGAARINLPHYPFQPLPKPNGPAPYRFDLSQLLAAGDIQKIVSSGSMVIHTVGDTGDYRGRQQDFVAQMMTNDSEQQPANKKPAFFYHLGDVVYFAGDIDLYGANFYETYKDYPGFIVAIPGNHDCQPDDPQDGPVDPKKVPLDGWVQNFMSKNPGQLGSLKTGSNRTQMDLPNVYWTFTTPFATILGLFSNVGETEGEIHPDQVQWFQGELASADPKLPLIVTVHHPPFSGDVEHSGSSAVDKVLTQSFAAAKRYPSLILSGHVHNYQRFTYAVQGPKGKLEIPYVVAGAGGYTNLGKLQKINGAYPNPNRPLALGSGLTLERYDHDNFGFLRLEVNKTEILGTYISAPYSVGGTPAAGVVDTFTVDLVHSTVATGASGGKKPTKPAKATGKKGKG
ncbi:MAG TPA: metallophosphoesterase [Verrucomicrobiae bacterium]|nr:metallophosphoesterase [Verrucomicrobiae bacterium]